MKEYDVIVIGGGAAGMIAAGRAAERGRTVLLVEKNNSLGEKLKITGGGRCNITNAEFNPHIFLKNYGKAASSLFSAFSQFGVQDTFDFFQSRGLPLVVQENKRAFPKTERATDVCKTLIHYLKKTGVTILTDTRVSRMLLRGQSVIGVSVGNRDYLARAVILATGGTSHPETGSTGDGFDWLRALGHTVHRPTPTIVPLAVEEKKLHSLAGAAVPLAKITYYLDGIKKFSRSGPLMFTHFGISGPVVLNSSGTVGDLLHAGRVTALVDMFPDCDERALEQRIIALFDSNKNKTLKKIFSQLAPIQLLSTIHEIDGDTRVHSITREQRKILIHTFKALSMTISRLMGLDRAVVADGGVDMREIDMKTLCSKLHGNLYIVGDLLHINRPSGGYSLQLCWTTGWVAGNSV